MNAGLAVALVVLGTLVIGASSRLGAEADRPGPDGPMLSAGDRVDGLPLTAVLAPVESRRHASFVYGDCVPEGDTGCAAPAEVQVWPACSRPLERYDDPAPGLAPERATIRGVPAVVLDEGRRIELHSGAHTVVVFAGSPGRALRIAAALRTEDGAVLPGERLPPPSAGRREGVVDC